MFRGVSALTVDPKGRVAIPARYRQRLDELCAGKLIITIDTEERCLLLYSLPDWLEIEGKIEALPSFNSAARRVQRLLIGHATELDMDSHGRILLPPLLRDYANLTKQVVIIGQGKKFELWDEANWQARREAWLAEDNKDDNTDLPEQLKSLSL